MTVSPEEWAVWADESLEIAKEQFAASAELMLKLETK